MTERGQRIEKGKIFVSYARKDSEAVARIVRALEIDGRQVFKDTADILPTEEWRARLEGLITAADTIVFCLSPDSAASEVCAWEVAFADRLKKRIVPVVIRAVDAPVPSRLAEFNYIFATAHDDFEQAMADLGVALDTNIAWIREHTRIGELAHRWAVNGRPKDELLRGATIDAVERWMVARPTQAPNLTDHALEFIAASRAEATAAARRARRLGSVIVALGVVAAGVSGLAYFGLLQPTYLDSVMNSVRNRLQEARLRPGDVKRDCDSRACPEMVVLPAGSFLMGSPMQEQDRQANEDPRRRITIARPLLVSKFEVTFEEWDACYDSGGCSYRPSDEGWGRGRRPVINVSWNDTRQYLIWLSTKTGGSYRLLSEAEWEYAARGITDDRGVHHAYSWGDDLGRGLANCRGCGSLWDNSQTTFVGSFAPNPFGLHDMHGNVAEHVQDCHDEQGYARAPTDGAPFVPTHDCNRVFRGGSFNGWPSLMRAAHRNWFGQDDRYKGVGFRVARSLLPSGLF